MVRRGGSRRGREFNDLSLNIRDRLRRTSGINHGNLLISMNYSF